MFLRSPTILTRLTEHDDVIKSLLRGAPRQGLAFGPASARAGPDCNRNKTRFFLFFSSLEPVIRRQRSFSNAFWPGHLLNKLRLCFASYETLYDKRRATSKNALFQVLSHTSQRSNHGYDNNERTWPSDGKYVKYGNIDQNKVYHLWKSTNRRLTINTNPVPDVQRLILQKSSFCGIATAARQGLQANCERQLISNASKMLISIKEELFYPADNVCRCSN